MIEKETWDIIKRTKVNITYYKVNEEINLNDLREIVISLLKYSNTHYNPEYPKTIATKIQRVIDNTAIILMEENYKKNNIKEEKTEEKTTKVEKKKTEKKK